MKKITLLTLLFVAPFLGIAQGPWEFTTASNDYTDWSKGACDQNQTDGVWELTTIGSNNPNITNETAGVNADVNIYAAVTLRLSAGGPTLMRLRIPRESGGFVYKTTILDPSQTGFVTYYIDASDTEWGGTENDIRFQFKDEDGSNGGANHTSTGETIEIDRVEFISSIPVTVQNSYTFDSSVEGWDDTTRAIVTAENGNLKVQLDGNGAVPDSNNSKVALNTLYAINATDNAYLHITMQNQSNDDQLKIVYPNTIDGGSVTVTQIVSTNDAGFVTYDFNLGSNPNWTGEINSIELVFDDSVAQEGNGIFLIDSIVVDNVLSTSEVASASFSVYPNPANDVINIKGLHNLSRVEMFDVTGKKVLETSQLTNDQLDMASYNAGIYVLRLTDVNNNSITKKLIIQ